MLLSTVVVAQGCISSSCGIFNGITGPLWGCLVKHHCPSQKRRGAVHDLVTFKSTKLYVNLLHYLQELKERRLYYNGGYAYAIRFFVITPYENACFGSVKDVFNFFQLLSRIYVNTYLEKLI